jgi:hypothetical protein
MICDYNLNLIGKDPEYSYKNRFNFTDNLEIAGHRT